MPASTVLPSEIAKFDALAGRWWDPDGPMAPLHQMNPLRCRWIAERLAAHHGRGGTELDGLSVLDVGCGAGLASEALARFGAHVTGLDAAGAALAAARVHAAASGLPITYREGMPEDLISESPRFDAVVSLEVVEHVNDRSAFLAALGGLLKPGGMIFLSTLNRTPQSFVFAKIGAEYLLRLLPRGTHDWSMFVTPAELRTDARSAGLRITDISGMTPGLLNRHWRMTSDVRVNYIVALTRP